MLPLLRINDVSYQRSLMDRILGCGTLYIQTAAEGAVVLDDVPDVEHVHLVLTGLLFDPRAFPESAEQPGWAAPDARDKHRGRPQYGPPAGQQPVWGEPYGPPR